MSSGPGVRLFPWWLSLGFQLWRDVDDWLDAQKHTSRLRVKTSSIRPKKQEAAE